MSLSSVALKQAAVFNGNRVMPESFETIPVLLCCDGFDELTSSLPLPRISGTAESFVPAAPKVEQAAEPAAAWGAATVNSSSYRGVTTLDTDPLLFAWFDLDDLDHRACAVFFCISRRCLPATAGLGITPGGHCLVGLALHPVPCRQPSTPR